MKHIIKLYLFCIAASLISCDDADQDKEDTPPVMEILISGTWHLQSARVDGAVQPDYLTGLQIKFQPQTFSVVNGEPIFQSTETWNFANEQASAINTGDNFQIELVQVEESVLVLGFTWTETTLGGGKSASIAGEHELTFSK